MVSLLCGARRPGCLAKWGTVCTILTLCPRGGSRWLAGSPHSRSLCSGPACPSLPLGPLRGPGKKSASLLSMSPSNTVIPWPLRLSQGVYKQHSSCRGVQAAPEFTSFSCLSWWAWPSPRPFLQLCSASGTPSPCPFICRTCPCRVGDGGSSLKIKKEPPLHSPPNPPHPSFLVSQDPGRAEGRSGARLCWKTPIAEPGSRALAGRRASICFSL